ncbi:MAG: bacillithiol biosynthesis deacetylase BshB1 [Crocinitomicaceae bacterium]|nr:bacillithiol biosynthesis deacetylase BshB1 [Crocinitomicaceae bacterium]
MNQKELLDILAFGAHPDDVELAASGTILKHISMGKRVGVVDLTRGEMGTRGSANDRDLEAKASSKILGLHARENLGFKDCFFENDKDHLLKVIQVIRRFRPKVILCNAVTDRHPDHSRASELVSRACYLSGLSKITTSFDNSAQKPFRPNAVYHYIQDYWVDPDFIVDISNFFDTKMKAILVFKTQFYSLDSKLPETPISTESFIDSIKARAVALGRYIGTDYAEGFTVERFIGVDDITKLK